MAFTPESLDAAGRLSNRAASTPKKGGFMISELEFGRRSSIIEQPRAVSLS
jgi:hypothetical protein